MRYRSSWCTVAVTGDRQIVGATGPGPGEPGWAGRRGRPRGARSPVGPSAAGGLRTSKARAAGEHGHRDRHPHDYDQADSHEHEDSHDHLSKAYGYIERFSEDADVVVHLFAPPEVAARVEAEAMKNDRPVPDQRGNRRANKIIKLLAPESRTTSASPQRRGDVGPQAGVPGRLPAP